MLPQNEALGKMLLVLGGFIMIAGLLIYFWDKIPYAGKLPGDILIEKKNFTFYFPLASSIILSIIVSLILYLISKFR